MNFRLALLSLLLCPATLVAQELRPTAMEFPERPIVNSNRVIGLGGAYVGVAEGADGHLYNPASFANRFAYSRDQLVDWDWTVYWLNLPRHRHPDITSTDADSFYLGAGVDLKVAGFGAGFHVFSSSYDFSRDQTDDRIALSETILALGFGYAFPIVDLAVGTSLHATSSEIAQNDEGFLLSATGSGINVGLLWSPTHYPLRIGATFRSRILKDDIQEEDSEASFLPETVEEPARIVFGASYMFGERKYNPRPTYGIPTIKKEPTTWGRRYILIAYDVVYTAPAGQDAISINGFLNEDFELSGEEGLFSMRVGVESEIIGNWLRLRTGYYPETSRIKGRAGRHHWTAGADLKIPVFWDWRLNTALDISSGYFNYGIGLGFWH